MERDESSARVLARVLRNECDCFFMGEHVTTHSGLIVYSVFGCCESGPTVSECLREVGLLLDSRVDCCAKFVVTATATSFPLDVVMLFLRRFLAASIRSACCSEMEWR